MALSFRQFQVERALPALEARLRRLEVGWGGAGRALRGQKWARAGMGCGGTMSGSGEGGWGAVAAATAPQLQCHP